MPVLVDGVHLAEAVHQARDGRPELLADVLRRARRHLLPNVQDGGGDALVVQVELVEHLGHRAGVLEGLGFAPLEGFLDDGGLIRGKIAQEGGPFGGLDARAAGDHGARSYQGAVQRVARGPHGAGIFDGPPRFSGTPGTRRSPRRCAGRHRSPRRRRCG